MQSDMGKLSADWKEIKEIAIYGAGTVSRICENLLDKVDIDIACVIDQDKRKQGTKWNGIPIMSFEQAESLRHGKKIVIMAAHAAYNEISSFLNGRGLVEFKDYCRIGHFISEWFWEAKGMNCVYHVDMTVTTKCTFNCKHCNMFIPYYEKQENVSFEQLKKNVDLFFERIDYAAYVGLIGGEPMLNPALKDIIVYLEENYATKFGRVTCTSNGSVVPSDDLLSVLKKYNVHLEISDYSDVIPYKNVLEQLEEKFKQYQFNYTRRPSLLWCDFGFPEHPFRRNEQEMECHLKCCRPEWNGLNDGKFYYCNVSWSAEKSGKFKLQPSDYIQLKDIDPDDKAVCHTLVELSRGTSSFCKVCGGCGKDNENYVPAGVQAE